MRQLSFWQSPVFLVNSRLGLCSAAARLLCCHKNKTAPLLPKLQGQFAEFLNHDSFAHLRIFIPATCVGLRYGYPDATRFAPFLGSPVSLSVRPKPPLNAHFRPDVRPPALRHEMACMDSSGILTTSPSKPGLRLLLRPRLTLR